MMMMMSSFRKKKPALNVHKKQFRVVLNEKHNNRTEQTQTATYCRTKQQTETETETNLESKTENRIELERNEQIYGQLII